MAYEGGYTSAVNDISRRGFEEVETRRRQQEMEQAAATFQQSQADIAEQKALAPKAMEIFAEMLLPRPPQGPQPPAPGQPSVPMAPPMAPQPTQGLGAGMQSVQLTPPPAAAPPGPPPGAAPMPQGAGPGAPMPAPGPPAGAPAPQGGMPMPPPGAAPAGGPLGPPQMPTQTVGWQPMPMPAGAPGASQTAGPGGSFGLPPPPKATDDAAYTGGKGFLPPVMASPEKFIEAMKAAGVPPEQRYKMLQTVMPMIEKQNKQIVAEAGLELKLAHALVETQKNVLAQWKAEEAEKRRMEELKTVKQPRADAYVDYMNRSPGAGAKGAGKGGGTGSGSLGANLTPETIEAEARKYNQTLKLPSLFRDQVSRSAILNKATEIAIAEEGGVGNIPGKAAEFGANKVALTANAKDLAAIGPYKEMLDQNANIAMDLAKKAIATDSRLLNRPLNWLRQNAMDNPDVAEFLAQTQIVSTEAARVLNNPRLVGQLTDSARHEMQGIINGEMPLNSFTRVLQRMQADGKNRVEAMERKHADLLAKMKGATTAPRAEAPGAQPAQANAKGWKLMTDKSGNKAYVSPDGKQFEEVK